MLSRRDFLKVTGSVGAGLFLSSSEILKAEAKELVKIHDASPSIANTITLSNPLDRATIIPTVTWGDFKKIFPNTNKLWVSAVLTDRTKYYMTYTSYDYVSKLQKVFIKDINSGHFFYKKVPSTIEIDDVNETFRVTSSLGTINFDTKTLITNVHLDTGPAGTVDMTLQGQLFRFNNPSFDASIIGDGFIWGIDVLSSVVGKVKGTPVTGYGTTERPAWSIKLMEVPGYRWIPFCTDNIKGMIFTLNLYRDAGFWYYGKYIKPAFFDLYVTYSGNIPKDMVAMLYFRNDKNEIDEITIKFKYMTDHTHEIAYIAEVYNRGNLLEKGFAWMEYSI